MSRMVSPSLTLISLSRVRIERVVWGSRAEVASSQQDLGAGARARAMATRCFCPPESSDG